MLKSLKVLGGTQYQLVSGGLSWVSGIFNADKLIEYVIIMLVLFV